MFCTHTNGTLREHQSAIAVFCRNSPLRAYIGEPSATRRARGPSQLARGGRRRGGSVRICKRAACMARSTARRGIRARSLGRDGRRAASCRRSAGQKAKPPAPEGGRKRTGRASSSPRVGQPKRRRVWRGRGSPSDRDFHSRGRARQRRAFHF